MVVSGAHDLVPELARAQLAVDPGSATVAVLERAGVLLSRSGLGAVHEFHLGVGLHGLHEGVGDAHRDVEIAQIARVLGVDELLDVGMVAAQHAHLRAAPRSGRFDGLTGAVEDSHVAHGAGGAALRAADPGAARADARKVIAHAATAAHGLRGLGQGRVDAGVAVLDLRDRVAHGLNEAVDQRGRQRGSGCRLYAPGRDEALGQRFGKALFPKRALFGQLGLRQRARHALVHLGDRGLVALAVFFDEDFCADRLGGQRRGGAAWFCWCFLHVVLRRRRILGTFLLARQARKRKKYIA